MKSVTNASPAPSGLLLNQAPVYCLVHELGHPAHDLATMPLNSLRVEKPTWVLVTLSRKLRLPLLTRVDKPGNNKDNPIKPLGQGQAGRPGYKLGYILNIQMHIFIILI